MPNLVGIGNSQVPTNAMLGGLAYQDSVGEIVIDKIKARTSDTAADIFVYDTRKDSDGGAWRHRTQNLSWYNEGANAFRGARKEFPVVAVIVSTSSNTIIYDGDDPNLSMWMEFSGSAGWLGGAAPAALSAKNGIITVGSNTTNQRLRLVFLLKDYCEDWATANSGGGHRASKGNFLVRNSDSPAGRTLDSTIGIVNRTINGVAMTVLPNAPIDASTGLPVPTIAIATDGGTNIINDNGTVTQGYQTIATENVDLHPAGYMLDGISGATNDSFSLYEIGTRSRVTSYGHRIGLHGYNTFLNEGTGECLFEGSSNKIAIAQSQGLLRIEEEIDDYASGLHNRTTSSYNTGWMLGDIKGVFLCDTDTTNLTGTEYVTNGNFVAGTSGWTLKVNAGGSITVVNSQVVITSQDSSNQTELQQTLTVPKGVNLSYSFDLVSGSIYNGGAATGNLGGGQTYQWVWNISGTGNQTLNLWFTPPGWSGSNRLMDNISIRTAEQDRSVHGGFNNSTGTTTQRNGLEAWGTINKTSVATGADLVGYNFPAATSYFQQPHNPDIGNVGSGNFSVMGWFYNTPRGVTFFDIASAGTPRFFISQMYNSDNFWFYMATGSGTGSWTTGGSGVELQTYWQFIAVKRVGTRFSYSLNGNDFISQINDAWGGSISGSVGTNRVTIGQNYTHTSNHFGTTGEMSLWKFSQSVPTNEQIKKIYNDEKLLFQENAKCTLHGTSDEITALTHDDTTDVLHVGTSGGRSEFQGLKRINNTTTAVTTAISASNELVAEQ